MEKTVSRILDRYEAGEISRREVVAVLAAAVVGGKSKAAKAVVNESEPTFSAVGLHHIALSVTDVVRSRDFYVQNLGLEVSNEWLPNQSFLNCGTNFVALFHSSRPGMHHYSYAIPDYDQKEAAERIRGAGMEPHLEGRRIYFDDPDGLVVQVSQAR